jgi:hypothetical protein
VVTRRRSSTAENDRDGAARGTPAPLTESEVEALRHGKLDEARVASILEGHRQPEVTEARRRPRKVGPVELDEGAVRELSEGSTPAAIQAAMESAAKKDRDRAAAIDERQDRPTRKPTR